MEKRLKETRSRDRVTVGLHLAAVHLGQDVLERLGRHLVGGLGAGRHELCRLAAGKGAVADDEDVLVRVVCRVSWTTSWLMRLVSRPAISPSKSGAFDARGPP